MRITIITLFPEMFSGVFGISMIKRAAEKGKIEISLVDLRKFGIGKHKTVDDRPYGGGAGMVLRVDVLAKAIESVKTSNKKELIILLDPKGKTFRQNTAEKLSKFNHLILICGHYEGFDERIRKFVDMEISIGDFVLSGGEIPAMTIVDAVIRLIPGVLKKDAATKEESFSTINNLITLEYPQYTRPEIFNKLKVPKELLTGDPKIISHFRSEKAKNLTKKRRPDLLEAA